MKKILCVLIYTKKATFKRSLVDKLCSGDTVSSCPQIPLALSLALVESVVAAFTVLLATE